MEYEISDDPQGGRHHDEDSDVIENHPALENQSSVQPDDYPDTEDRALHIPEQDD